MAGNMTQSLDPQSAWFAAGQHTEGCDRGSTTPQCNGVFMGSLGGGKEGLRDQGGGCRAGPGKRKQWTGPGRVRRGQIWNYCDQQTALTGPVPPRLQAVTDDHIRMHKVLQESGLKYVAVMPPHIVTQWGRIGENQESASGKVVRGFVAKGRGLKFVFGREG
ncbi:hypothetical protein H8959_006650 [Pygathrix nigripes]